MGWGKNSSLRGEEEGPHCTGEAPTEASDLGELGDEEDPPFLYSTHHFKCEREKRGGAMERSVPVRKPHSSTVDLLTWPEAQAADQSEVDSVSRRLYQMDAIPMRRGVEEGTVRAATVAMWAGRERTSLETERARARREESGQVESERWVVGHGGGGSREKEMAMDLDDGRRRWRELGGGRSPGR